MSAAGEIPPAVAAASAGRGAPGTLIFADGFESGDVCNWTQVVGAVPAPSCPKPQSVTANSTYSSEGKLLKLAHENPTEGTEDITLFYFGERPVALRELVNDVETWKWITTDHLGTPIALTSSNGTPLWRGGFEPYGQDFAGATAAGMFLRLPGQWTDPAWESSGLGAGVYYNVHRWYEVGTGRYASADPLGLRAGINLMAYARANPLLWTDPDGLRSRVCCAPIEDAFALRQFKHCFIEVQDTPGAKSRTYGLHGMGSPRRSWGGPLGCTFENDGFDQDATSDNATECGAWNETCGADECAENQYGLYPRASDYRLMGPNSNTFAGTVARACGLNPPPIAGTWHTPGWESAVAPTATGKTCPPERGIQ